MADVYPGEGNEFVNKQTGEIATVVDDSATDYTDWVECSIEDVDKWQTSYELYISTNGNNIYECNGWESMEDVGQLVYDLRESGASPNKNPTEDEYEAGNTIDVTYDELLLGYNNSYFILPTDSAAYNSDYNASKYTFADLMKDNGASGYNSLLELETYLNTVLAIVNSAYNSYLGNEIFGNTISVDEPAEPEDIEDIQIFNGLYEDAFDIQAI